MEITFSGKYKKDELLEALKIHYMRSKPEIVVRIISIALIILAYIFYIISTADINLGTIFVTLPVIIMLYIFARPFILPYEVISKVIKDKVVQEAISGFASNDRFIWKTSSSSSDMKWDVFKKAEIRENLLMLYQDNNWYFVIPRNFLRNETDWQNFLSLIRDKL